MAMGVAPVAHDRRLRGAAVLALLVLAAVVLSGSVADVGRDRRLVVALTGEPGLDPTAGLLVPGAAVRLDLTLTNPYTRPVRVTRLAVTVTGVSAPRADPTRACGTADFTAAAGRIAPLTVPPRSTTSLAHAAVPPERWPSVAMADGAWDQDGCRDASVRLGLKVWGRVA